MAEPDTATLAVAPLPSPDDLERAEAFAREPFLLEGEDASVSLAPGMPRRVALEWVLKELAEGHTAPSSKWRRRWSLLLGLDRLLSQDEPTLVDGTVLSAHQVDALSGTLTALLAESQRGANGKGNGNGNGAATLSDEPLMLASAAIPGEEELPEELVEDEPDEEPLDWSDATPEGEEPAATEAVEDPNAAKRFWFEHATGAGKTVAALGFVEASRTGGILILTHRRNLVDQFHGELRDRGYAKRISPALLAGKDNPHGPVTVETYQWFVRNAGKISDAYTIVICDEAHTALGEKTSAAIRAWSGPVFVGMTATGALIARHVTDLFPTQTSRFDLAQAARRGVIAPLRAVRIPPGPGVRTIAKVPLRRGEVDTEFDQEMLAELLDQLPFNLAIADLYKTRFNGVPGVVYSAGVRHAYNVAQAFRDSGMKAQAVSGETKKRELARILAAYERGDIDVLVNAQLLAEGWNSPRATVCMHLAPTASKRIYQQRVGRVTRRHPGKEAGIVVDFVHPATKHDDPVVTLHSLLDRDVYRGGAIVVGPVRRGRGRRLRVERRVVPVTSDENRRIEVFERELWRIAVEHLDYGEQVQWAALAGARVAPAGWRRARAMLHFDEGGELKRAFLLTAVERNKNPQLRLRALQEIAASRDAEAFDRAIEMIGGWPREEKREGVKVVLQSLAEKKIGRRDQANNWIWACAEMTREVHEEYAVQRWPETKRLLGLARELFRGRPRAQCASARACGAAAGPASRGCAARRRVAAHRRGRRGHQRRPHAHVPQARRAGARAAAQLPEGRQGPPRAAASQEGQGRRERQPGRAAGGRRGDVRRRRGRHDRGEAEAPALVGRRLTPRRSRAHGPARGSGRRGARARRGRARHGRGEAQARPHPHPRGRFRGEHADRGDRRGRAEARSPLAHPRGRSRGRRGRGEAEADPCGQGARERRRDGGEAEADARGQGARERRRDGGAAEADPRGQGARERRRDGRQAEADPRDEDRRRGRHCGGQAEAHPRDQGARSRRGCGGLAHAQPRAAKAPADPRRTSRSGRARPRHPPSPPPRTSPRAPAPRRRPRSPSAWSRRTSMRRSRSPRWPRPARAAGRRSPSRPPARTTAG